MAQRTLNRRSRVRDDEDEYDPPEESGNLGRYDDEDDEPPRRGRARGRSRDEDDEDEPPRGRRSRRSRDEDDDEEPPRRSRRSSRDEDDEDEAPRRSRRSRRDEDDEDEAPRRSRDRAEKPNSTGSGWKAFQQKREEHSDYVKTYKLPEGDKEIIKILDAEPFSVYSEHWLDEIVKGKKSFVCIGDDCPLCNIGDKSKVYAMFNVVDLRDPEDPKVIPWKVSQTVADVLEGYAKDSKTSPINRDDLYFSVVKTGGGKKGRVQTNISSVKARDLDEDWGIEPLSAKEIASFQRFIEEDVLVYSSRKQLREVANSLD